ncbi:kinesin-like protein Klp68D isoform X2 [Epargyreus clarus]|uniref:kinesin-like protein Klp68D isoform X2 n=1 Tax=Epargyreus clarus TaxID=520877 RepID=UPI003C2F5EB9
MEKSARPRTALNECVKVVVRCRPLSDREKNEGYEEVKKKRTEQTWYERLSSKSQDNKKFDVPLQVVKVWPERGAVQVYNPKGQDKLFTYDAAYDCSADTQTMYDEMVRPLVASVLDGFNGCVFAYGQTGTGKTHTMEGTPDHEGIIPRAFRHIWAHIENNASPDVTHLVSCSYVELYLEDVRDLLSKDCKKLTIRGQELNGFYIPEMTSVVCKSAAEMVRTMRAGNRHRAAGRTDMNEHSSRSHAVFLVTVETAHRDTNRIRVGKLNLVDLAGSERQRKTGASAERLREAARINQALSSLGNVISALAENSPHVPYRDSKLTRILQDSLGGNSKTIMIANIGPASFNYDETITTLRYAHRAKAIKNKPVRNEDPKDAKLREYQAEIERLRALIEQRKLRKPARPRAKLPDTLAVAPSEPEPAVDLESAQQLAESSIEQERSRAGELEAQIAALEARLVQGGGGRELLHSLNASQQVLQQRNEEIAARKKREVEMQQRIDLEEETTAIVTNTFATLQQEVDHKTQRLKKCLSKYACLREEMVEQREAHDAERREHEALQAALLAELRRRLLLADSFVPDAGRPVVLRLRYNDDADCWELPEHRYWSVAARGAAGRAAGRAAPPPAAGRQLRARRRPPRRAAPALQRRRRLLGAARAQVLECRGTRRCRPRCWPSCAAACCWPTASCPTPAAPSCCACATTTTPTAGSCPSTAARSPCWSVRWRAGCGGPRARWRCRRASRGGAPRTCWSCARCRCRPPRAATRRPRRCRRPPSSPRPRPGTRRRTSR